MAKTKRLSLMLIVVLVSFLGFITENIFIFIRFGFVDNRNMTLPFLLGYGLAILLIYLLFGTPQKPRFFTKELTIKNKFISMSYYFIICFLSVSIGELILGHMVEWICNIKWWNYSNIPLNITRYTSVPTSTAFSLFITLFMRYLFSPLLSKFSKIPPKIIFILTVTLIFLLSIDFIHSGIYMLINKHTLDLWKIEIKTQ